MGHIGLARADDGVLYERGGPRLMKGNGTIRMVQEFVRAKVGTVAAKFYCRFVLKNEGPGTVARIAFPDGAMPDDDPDASPSAVLKHFRSCVDGAPVRTETRRADAKESFQLFHMKTVRFSRHQTRVVEDWYESPLDDGATSTFNWYVRGLRYVMSSGGSWKGKIDKATVQIEFLTRRLVNPHPEPLDEIGDEYGFRHWDRVPRNYVYWGGFAQPYRQGRSLIFRRRNFKPDENSNIHLAFGARKWGE